MGIGKAENRLVVNEGTSFNVMRLLAAIFLMMAITGCDKSANNDIQFSLMLKQLDPALPESVRAEAVQNLRNLGTNAFPLMVIEMNSIKWHVPVEKDQEIIRRSQRLGTAFEIFGTNLAPVAQDFVANLNIHSNFIGALNAFVVMGGQGLPYVDEALTNDESPIRFAAVSAVMKMGQTNPEIAAETVPTLIQLLKDQSASVRCLAGESLGLYCTKPEVSVPALLDCARKDTDAVVRCQAIKAVGKIQARFGTTNSETHLALENISTQDESPSVRACAMRVLTGQMQ